MTVLHGAWLGDRMLLWGETDLAPATSDPVPSLPGAEIHILPHGADTITLEQATSECNIGIEVGRFRDAAEYLVWLPSDKRHPTGSRFFNSVNHRPLNSDKLVIAPWRVNGLALEWNEWLMLLGRIGESPRIKRGLIAGQDLLRWSEVLRYAGSMVARRLFLPSMRKNGDLYEAVWQPVFDSAENKRLQKFAQRLPAVALCLTDLTATESPFFDPHYGVNTFVAEAVDRLVRAAITTRLSRAHADHGYYFSGHDAWVASLRSDQTRAIRWSSSDDLTSLLIEVQSWHRPVDVSAAMTSRVCFRIDEPLAAEPDVWRLHHLIVTGEDEHGTTTTFDNIWDKSKFDDMAREGLLVALGQATLLVPFIAQRPSDQYPAGLALSTDEAHLFLTQHAPLLEAAGYVVQTPSWWASEKERPRLELIANAQPQDGTLDTKLTLDSMVTVDWAVALGGIPLTNNELKTLANAKTNLVNFRGSWMVIDRARAAEALRLWQRRKREVCRAQDMIRFMLGQGDNDLHGLNVTNAEGSGWIGDLLQRLRGETALEPLPPPDGFEGALRPYQERGHAWLAFLNQWGFGACLADDMGLGKTVQTLAHVARLMKEGEKRPVLLVCPASLITNWEREAARFVPQLKVMVHHGPERNMRDSFVAEAGEHAMVITCYPLLYRDFDWLRRVKWSGVVLDEAQNIKNSSTRQSQAARALQASYRIALTGTPVENNVGDIWSIMDFLNPGLLGSKATFRERFQHPIQTGTDPYAREALRRCTAPFILRRLKTDRNVVPDLPEKREARVFCSLTREQVTLYEAVVSELADVVRTLGSRERQGVVLAALTRLKQVCNHPAHFLSDDSPLRDRSGKLTRLVEMLEEVLEQGAAALVFTQYAAMGRLLQQHLQQEFGVAVPFMHGGVPRMERDNMVKSFQTENGPPIFVLSLKTGGTGLNLTRASHVFHYDRWWNPAVENQATDRAFRIGQSRDVMVHKFVCAGTLEEKVDAMIEDKKTLAGDVIAIGEAWLARLGDEQLFDLLALAQETRADE